MNKAGRLRLINSVLTLIPTYLLAVFELKKWAIKQIDKLRRNFLWTDASEAKPPREAIVWSDGLNP